MNLWSIHFPVQIFNPACVARRLREPASMIGHGRRKTMQLRLSVLLEVVGEADRGLLHHIPTVCIELLQSEIDGLQHFRPVLHP